MQYHCVGLLELQPPIKSDKDNKLLRFNKVQWTKQSCQRYTMQMSQDFVELYLCWRLVLFCFVCRQLFTGSHSDSYWTKFKQDWLSGTESSGIRLWWRLLDLIFNGHVPWVSWVILDICHLTDANLHIFITKK